MLGFLPDKWWNASLAKEPLNWAIIFGVASLWLFLLHSLMTMWLNHTGATQSAFDAPGMIGPGDIAAQFFSTPASPNADVLSNFAVGEPLWVSPGESRYAEDGWYGPV